MLAAVFLSVILLKCQLPSNNALPPSNVGPVGPVDPVDPPATRVPPITIGPPATVRPITLQPPCLCPVCPRWPPYPWDVPYPWPYPWCPWPCRRYYVYDVSELLDAAIYRLDALSKLPQYRNLVPIFKALIDMASDPSLLQEDGDYSEVDEIPDARKLLYAAKNIGSSRKATPSPDTLKQAMEEESSSTTSPAPAAAPKWYKIVRFLRILKRILEILLGL
ncbi:hypothetical protein RB195_003593 [Necator americanus]|uniref:Uncharacterized protein n=1 Tax=Necator americanus TaxID=51031 RepID=A0ABR1DQK7_NECAM